MTTRRWVDWVNVMLGGWLIASPWLVSVATSDRHAAWNSWSVGAAIVTLAFLAMYKPAISVDAVGVVLGAWLIASPWMLGFADVSAAATNASVVGMLVIVYALWAMRIDMSSGNRAAHEPRTRLWTSR